MYARLVREMDLPIKTIRDGALSPIRNQRLLQEVVSSVKIRVFDLTYGDIVQQVETEDLKSFQCGFESHYPYHKLLFSGFFSDFLAKRK